MPLIYHTFFAEYEGETPGDILRAVHREAAEEIPITFEDWWKHQQTTWKSKYNIDVPDIGTVGAEEKLFKILIDVGALEEGEMAALEEGEKKRRLTSDKPAKPKPEIR